MAGAIIHGFKKSGETLTDLVISTSLDISTATFGMSVSQIADIVKLVEVDGKSALTISEDQCTSTEIHNVGQGANDVVHNLPSAVAGLSFIATVGETQAANKWGFKAYAGQYIYLDGTIGGAAGTVKFAAPAVGNYATFFTFKRASDYAWVCKTGNGTVTTE
jgi:hypothetical protein